MLTLKQQLLLIELFPENEIGKANSITYKSARFFENISELVENGLVFRNRTGKGITYKLTNDGKIFTQWLQLFFIGRDKDAGKGNGPQA